jgi:zinc protease
VTDTLNRPRPNNLAILLALICAAAPALAQRSTPAEEFDVHGLKVIVKQRPAAPTVAVGLFVRGGTSDLTPATAGLTALLLNVMTDGSARFPRSLLRAETSRLGSRIGYGVNSDYSVLSMTSTRENFERTWDMFTDAALHPALLQADIDRERNVMIVAAQGARDTPDESLQDLQRATYKSHSYAIDPTGTPETLAKFTADDLRAYHRKIMQSSRLLMVLVGDVDVAAVRKLATAAFGQLSHGDYKAGVAPPLEFETPTVRVEQRSLPTNYVQGVFAGPVFGSPDEAAMQVAISILNDRVFEEVRVRRNLSYAPHAFLNSAAATIGGIYVTAVDANQAIAVMLNEMTRLKKEPVSADTLTAFIGSFTTRSYLSMESSAAQVSTLAQYELIGGGWRNADNLLERERKVTAADVQRVSQKYMRNLQFVVVGDDKVIDRQVFTKQP